MNFLIFLTLLISNGAFAHEKMIEKMCLRMKYSDCSLVKAITKHESGFDPLAIGHDGAGSLGLMQIKCSTAWTLDKEHGRKPIICKHLFIPRVNIKYGIEYLQYLHNLITPKPTVQELLSAYNGGYRFDKRSGFYKVKYCNAISIKKKRNCRLGVDLFNNGYVELVMYIYNKYRGEL